MEKNVNRPYTPITPNSVKGKLDFLIKVYPQGKMSTHIDSLKIGDTLELMGPIGNLKYTPKMYPMIGMIAGGTGITPLYQIIQHVLTDPQDTTSITLLYANNQEIDILLREELHKFQQQHPSRFFVHHVLAEAPSDLYEKGFVTEEIIKKYLNTKTLLMVCGPPKMEEVMLGYLDSLNVQKIHQMVFTYSATHSDNQADKPTLQQPQEGTKEYTMEEVATHKREGDCWLVIEGKVYNITTFVDEHPGGYIIMDGAGIDATKLFNVDFEHTDDAKDELKKLEIGKLKI